MYSWSDNGGQESAHLHSELMKEIASDRRIYWLYISWGGVLFLVIGLLWSAFFNVEEVTSGTAKVIPSSREQVLQSLEGGILQALMVKEGDRVEKGQIVARIDPTRAEASFKESANRLLAMRAQSARLEAESQGKAPDFPPDVKQNPELVRREMEAYDVKRRALDESVRGYTKTRELVHKELDIARQLAAKELLSNTEVLKLQREANEAELQITDRENRYRADANAELSRVEVEIASLSETAMGRQDTLSRTEVRSPAHGIINNIHINTIGGVIQPGEEIMELTPLDDTLLVETKIKPSDVAFIAVGQEAMVKISAYDYSIYGGLKGYVENISSGALKDEDAKGRARPGSGDETYYRVIIRTEGNTLTKAGSRPLNIIPGMTATVDIRTGEKSLLTYMIRPLLRVQEAFREK